MLTKLNLIELVQYSLQDAPPDVREKALPGTITGHATTIISSIIKNDRKAAEGMAIPYNNVAIESTTSGGLTTYYAMLPAPPMMGRQSITRCEDSHHNQVVISQTYSQYINSKTIDPNPTSNRAYIEGKRLIFPSQPVNYAGVALETVKIYMIPNIMQMGDNDYVIMSGYEDKIVDAIVAKLMPAQQLKSESKNDNRVDRENG